MVRAGGSTDCLCHLCFLVYTPLKLMSVMSVCVPCVGTMLWWKYCCVVVVIPDSVHQREVFLWTLSCFKCRSCHETPQWFHLQHYVIIWGHLTFCKGRFGDVKLKKNQVCDFVCGCGLSIKVFWELVYRHIVGELSERHFWQVKSSELYKELYRLLQSKQLHHYLVREILQKHLNSKTAVLSA